MKTNELYVIFLLYVTTKKPIWIHVFPSSQSKVRDYVTIHYTVVCRDSRDSILVTFYLIQNLKILPPGGRDIDTQKQQCQAFLFLSES